MYIYIYIYIFMCTSATQRRLAAAAPETGDGVTEFWARQMIIINRIRLLPNTTETGWLHNCQKSNKKSLNAQPQESTICRSRGPCWRSRRRRCADDAGGSCGRPQHGSPARFGRCPFCRSGITLFLTIMFPTFRFAVSANTPFRKTCLFSV